ncbi:bifunctional peptidase and arginyl-hydroxylase JMJD5 [Papilio machaon]|uniref:bifunctional peptidase and arginyl-hydroxylase JMJD5 n=1 Tax=Papilio machaon TaxID=76193 RepID=UPI001E6642E5|nr:bifunctional peptidase and arginyl-hydroxylase JMJD5 [Papilio machaon]
MGEMLNRLVQFQNQILVELQETSDLGFSSSSLLTKYVRNINSLDSTTLLKIEAILDYMYELINAGNWKDVKLSWRKTITVATYLKLIVIFKSSTELTEDLFKELFKIIDHGILFGCPLKNEPKLLQKCAEIMNSSRPHVNNIENMSSEVNDVDIQSNYDSLCKIDVLNCPSMETFFRDYILKERPAILENCINHWPALEKWKDQNYFIKLAGLRTVAIELGSDYTKSEWTQKLMTLEEFIKNYMFNTDGPVGYLAQYQLFDHIPELKLDITEPEYCCFSDTNEPVDIMAWYGPKGTLSPLHYDAKRNLLAQVIGKKHMFLFSPNDTDYLYPHDSQLLHNTAQVDPRKPDLEKYPKYKEVKPYYCTLSPGQMLFIPPKWWHCVESLSISFSVSFWWE